MDRSPNTATQELLSTQESETGCMELSPGTVRTLPALVIVSALRDGLEAKLEQLRRFENSERAGEFS